MVCERAKLAIQHRKIVMLFQPIALYTRIASGLFSKGMLCRVPLRPLLAGKVASEPRRAEVGGGILGFIRVSRDLVGGGRVEISGQLTTEDKELTRLDYYD